MGLLILKLCQSVSNMNSQTASHLNRCELTNLSIPILQQYIIQLNSSVTVDSYTVNAANYSLSEDVSEQLDTSEFFEHIFLTCV